MPFRLPALGAGITISQSASDGRLGPALGYRITISLAGWRRRFLATDDYETIRRLG